MNSVGDLSASWQLSAFPNPVGMQGACSISGMEGDGPWIVEWRDAAGRNISTLTVAASATSQGYSAVIATPDRSGIYVVSITTTSGLQHAVQKPATLRILVQ